MNARWMDNSTGRFISIDPAKDGFNWYIYAGNNPTTFIDPTGLTLEDAFLEHENDGSKYEGLWDSGGGSGGHDGGSGPGESNTDKNQYDFAKKKYKNVEILNPIEYKIDSENRNYDYDKPYGNNGYRIVASDPLPQTPEELHDDLNENEKEPVNTHEESDTDISTEPLENIKNDNTIPPDFGGDPWQDKRKEIAKDHDVDFDFIERQRQSLAGGDGDNNSDVVVLSPDIFIFNPDDGNLNSDSNSDIPDEFTIVSPTGTFEGFIPIHGTFDSYNYNMLTAETPEEEVAATIGLGIGIAGDILFIESMIHLASSLTATKGTVNFSNKVSAQKQIRHLKGTAPTNKSYLNSLDDAQRVLDAYNNGNYRLINQNPAQNTVTIEVKGVSGRYVNVGNPNGLPDLNLPTNKFMIQSTKAPKVVPVNPYK